MRRFLSICISVVLLFTNISVVSEAHSDIVNKESELEVFTKKLTELISEYDKNTVLNETAYSENSATVSYSEGTMDVYASSGNNSDNSEEIEDTSNVDYTNRLIVKSEKELDPLDAVEYISGYNDLHILQYANSEDFYEAFEYYSSLESVEYLEEDMLCEIDEAESVSDDAVSELTEATVPTQLQSDIFGFTALKDYLIETSFDTTESIEIAVVDTGIAYDHDYLVGRVEPTGFDSVSGKSCYDDNGHGTHIAGIIAANTFDNVKIKPYKVLNDGAKGTVSQVYLGIEAAVEDGVDIINLSLSIIGENEVLHDAVRNAYNNGIIVVVSAGNNGVNLDNTYYSPACFDEVITVSACDDDKYIADFSNYGSLCEVAAPGVGIISTHLDNSYKTLSGTSMAAPFVSAAVTYILMNKNNITPEEVTNELLLNTKPCRSYFGGRYITVENITKEKEMSPNPVFSYTKSTFTEPFELELSCADETAEIYYTTSLAASGEYMLYSEPVPVNYDMTVSAFTISEAGAQSSTFNYSYTRMPDSASLFTIDANGALIGYSGDSVDVVVPAKVNSKYVKSISSSVFKDNKNIRSVGLMAYVTSIADDAFSGCTNLEYIRGKGVTAIGNNAFYGCEKLLSFTGSKVETVGDYAFYGCSSLKNFDFNSVESVGISAFENVTNISGFSSTFLTEIGERAFYNSGITNVNLNLAESIGAYAFAECKGIERVYLPRATEIEEGAFENCSKVVEVDTDSLQIFSCDIFKGCKNIASFSFDSATQIKEFSDGYSFSAYFPLLEVFSAKSLINVPAGAFSDCKNLVSADLASVITVGDNAFSNCFNLLDVNIEALISVGEYAFSNCSAMSSFNATNIKEIKGYAFYNCFDMPEICLDYVETIYANSFSNTPFKTADFRNLVTVPENAFNDSMFESVIFSCVKTIMDLPRNGIVAVAKTAETITASCEDILATIYANEGALAIEYAIKNGLEYVIMDNSTVHIKELDFVAYGDKNLEFETIGFNRKYYLCYAKQPILPNEHYSYNTDGNSIFEFNPADYEIQYPYYYYVIYSSDNGQTSVYYTRFCRNSNYIPYSEKENVDIYFGGTTQRISTNEQLVEDITDIITVNPSYKYEVTPSYDVNGKQYIGTNSKVTIGGVFSFFVTISGDVNGDSLSDVLDLVLIEKKVNKHLTLNTAQFYAADSNSDSRIDNLDYQNFVNMVLSE